MRLVFPSDHVPLSEDWIRPLQAVARSIAGVRRYRFFDLDDFMIMAQIRRRERPDLHLYKHVYTRRYLNLDAAGHAYRYVSPRSFDSKFKGRYVAHKDPRRALDHLELWLLPWMKHGLEEFRFGVPFEHRWILDPDEVGDAGDDEIAAMARREMDEIEAWRDEHREWLAEARAASGVDDLGDQESW